MRIVDCTFEKSFWLRRQLDTLTDLRGIDRLFYIAETIGTEAERHAELAGALAHVRAAGPLGQGDFVLIDRSIELGRIDPDRAELLVAFCAEMELPIERIIYASQDLETGARLTNRFRAAGSPPPAWLWAHHYLWDLLCAWKDRPFEDFGFDALFDAPFGAMCLNRKLRPHRLALAAKIAGDPFMRERVLLTFEAKARLFQTRQALDQIAIDLPSFREPALAGLDALTNDFPPIRGEYGDLGPVRSLPEEAVRRSALCFVTESDYRHQRVTEKALKPLVFHRPFIVAGAAGSLAIIKGLGFRTFGELIDERYDDEANPDRRMALAYAELERLVRECADETARRRFLEAARPICAHNVRHAQTEVQSLVMGGLRDDLTALAAGERLLGPPAALQTAVA